MNPFEGASCS